PRIGQPRHHRRGGDRRRRLLNPAVAVRGAGVLRAAGAVHALAARDRARVARGRGPAPAGGRRGVSAAPAGWLAGRCVTCGGASRFLAVPAADGSLRESLRCEACGCIARQRAVAGLLLDAVGPSAEVYLTEQASALYLAPRRRLPRLHGSEWTTGAWQRLRMSAWLVGQGVSGLVRLVAGSPRGLCDAGLDAVASLEVLERVPDYRRALHEFARVLRPGGLLLLCVPYDPALAGVDTLATVDAAGTVTHLRPPEYHGDPLGGGVLCFHRFGDGLPEAVAAAGFEDVEAMSARDAAAGLPQLVWVISAERSRGLPPPEPPGT